VVPAPNNEAMVRAHGVLLLTLRPAEYHWEFVTIAGIVADSGTTACLWSGAAERPPAPPPVDSVPPPPPVDTAPPSPPTAPAIVLTLRGERRADGKAYLTLDWTGAAGASVDVYRNGPLLLNTLNDGHYVNSQPYTGSVTYRYKVCEVGRATCSNEATVTLN
jgi:hypothetical protein